MKFSNLAVVLAFVLTKTALSFPIDTEEIYDIVERDTFNLTAVAREVYEERSFYDEDELLERRSGKPAPAAAGVKRPATPPAAPPAKKPTTSKPVYEIQCSKY
ncbi:hypothetical protein P691DRAFT_343066, partial [Macrolepiota fuliginosa MF-IS2]